MFNLIFSQIYNGNDKLISTGFNMALPKVCPSFSYTQAFLTTAKLYAISMMWTLNARRTIRASHSSRNGMTHSSSNDVTINRGTRRTRVSSHHERSSLTFPDLTGSVRTWSSARSEVSRSIPKWRRSSILTSVVFR